MKPLFNEKQYKNTKSRDKLPCLCYHCNNIFFLLKHEIVKIQNKTSKRNFGKFCDRNCYKQSKILYKEFNCFNCQKIVYKTPSQIKKSKNIFCSNSCAAVYNNKHKTTGTTISSFEKYCQTKLKEKYPNLEFHFNRKDTIDSELDIYIPNLKLAFELNGIFHYKPIFGEQKLKNIQNNDLQKIEKCLQNNIKLFIINISKYQKSTNNNKCKILLQIINLIEQSQSFAMQKHITG